jgi:hypothetical protein
VLGVASVPDLPTVALGQGAPSGVRDGESKQPLVTRAGIGGARRPSGNGCLHPAGVFATGATAGRW